MNSLCPGLSALAAGALLLAVGGCSHPSAAETGGPSASAAQNAVDRVRVGPPQRKTLILTTAQPGRVESFEETPMFPKVAGYVEHVLVDIGDRVDKGQVLVRLWVPELQDEQEQKEALVAQAEAEVQQAEAAVQAAEARINTARAGVSLAEAGIGRSEADYQRWKSEYERIKELAAQGSVTGKLADEALNQFQAAEASRTEARAHVDSASAEWNEEQANAAKSRADLAAAKARLRVAAANLKQAQTLLAYTEIKAPFDGMVTQRGVDTGHYVQPASGAMAQPLLVVASWDRVRVSVDVPELEAPLVETGDPAVVRVQSLRQPELEAEVARTSWSLHSANRSLRAEIDLANEKGQLRPGMYAMVTIQLDERNDVLVLPITAIVQDGEGAHCCRVESGQVQFQPVELGLRSGNEVEILSGLSGGEAVVLAQASSLRPGQPVEVIAAQP
ncbi:MAG: efflux RND transporter periplasmic adaptor subunit [Pirellulaceae bacterium]|nr:efflux RND transporter periplasmic adaptor subunit [Pirellulaceae bacterium]